MYFEFYLDDLLIDEPQGFADIILNMKRDDNWHGIFFEASTSDLIFYGEAAEYLRHKKETDGLKANVTFKALQSCGIYEDLETILEGKLNFGKYVASCGNNCVVTIPVEQTGCIMTLRNRYDQKVDMDSTLAFDKVTALQVYDKLGFDMELAAQAILAADEAHNSDQNTEIISDQITWVENVSPDQMQGYIGPRLDNATNSSLGAFNPPSFTELYGLGFSNFPTNVPFIIDTTTLLGGIKCNLGNITISFRLKGSHHIVAPGISSLGLTTKIWRLPVGGDETVAGDWVQEYSQFLSSASTATPDASFDQSGSITISLAQGDKLCFAMFAITGRFFEIDSYSITLDPETFFKAETNTLCENSDAKVYAINESLSHVAEAITDGCLRVKSDYYGRTDSEPYSSSEDGCGALRILTSGLQIRRAENPSFFASLKDLFDGLKGIDNIGLGIEDNSNLPNSQWLRVEPIEYFYQDIEILSLPFVPQAKTAIQEQLHYSIIKSGYKKWEIENINGLDEFNSNREYRTGLSSINNTLDITSAFIAGGYPWEITREQSFADTGAADTTYDNEIFIACVERDAYGFHIEQGNIDNATNIFSPSTAYNWRIRPFYNLMRWFKSIINSYPNIIDTTNKLFFSSGTGNFLAAGQIAGAYPACKLENGPKAENKDLYINDFSDQSQGKPIWKPEYITLTYTLSVKQYKDIKAFPYGFVSVQCGQGEYVKAYIQEARYRLTKGTCDFVLKLKWE